MKDYYNEWYEWYDTASIIKDYPDDIANLVIEHRYNSCQLGFGIREFIHGVKAGHADKMRNEPIKVHNFGDEE